MGTSDSTRARRFALPDLADERAGQSIEAFLHGRRANAANAAVFLSRLIMTLSPFVFPAGKLGTNC